MHEACLNLAFDILFSCLLCNDGPLSMKAEMRGHPGGMLKAAELAGHYCRWQHCRENYSFYSIEK